MFIINSFYQRMQASFDKNVDDTSTFFTGLFSRRIHSARKQSTHGDIKLDIVADAFKNDDIGK